MNNVIEEIKHVRIDGRLIHGQVVTKWLFTKKIDRIIVVDDELLNNPIEKNALKLSTPDNIKLSILGAESAARNLNSGKYLKQNIMILVKKPKYLKELINYGVTLEKINVGNISQSDGSIRVKASIFLKKEDIEDLKYLLSKNIKITAQMVPNDTEEKMDDILEKIKL